MNSNWSYSPKRPNLGQIRWFFEPSDLAIWRMTLKNNRAPLFSVISNWRYSLETPKRPNLGQNWQFLEPCDLAIWCMTLKNNRAPLLCYFKLCTSFRSHWWIQSGVAVQKLPIWVKIEGFFSCVTLQCDVWPCKTIGHLFYSTSTFVHHFVAIGEFKLNLQSGNAQFG